MRTITRYLLALFLCLTYGSMTTQAQINIGKIIKKKKDKLVKKGKEELDNAFDKKMQNLQSQMDSTNFSYAIALSDNASFAEDRERGAKWSMGALEIYRAEKPQEKDELDEAKRNNDLGQMFFASNKFTLADGLFRTAQSDFEAKNRTDNIYYARVLANRGLLYHARGQFAKSEEFTQKALELRKDVLGEDHASYASSLNNLAMLYKDLGKYNESEKLINQSRQILEKAEGKASKPYVIVSNNKAMLLQKLGRYQDATNLMKDALSAADKLKGMREKSNLYQKLLVNLSLLYQETENYSEAEKILLEAISLKEKRLGKKHPDYAYMLNHLASLYTKMNDKLEKVEELLIEASDIYKKKFGEEHPTYANTISNLGNYYRVKGNLTKAEPLLKKTLTIREKVLDDKHPDFVKSQEDLALVYWQKGNSTEAFRLYKSVIDKADDFVRRYFPPMSETEKEKYWDRLRPTYTRFYAFASRFGDQNPEVLKEAYKAHLATKAILLSSTNKIKKQILNSGDSKLVEDYNSWIAQKEALARYYMLSKEELQTQGINRDSLERATNSLERSLSSRSQIFSQSINEKALSYEDIVSKLSSGEVAVDVISFKAFDKQFIDQTHYLALIAKPNTTSPEMVLLENGSALDTKFFKYYRNAIKAKKEDKYSYKMFWEKIDQKLPQNAKVYTSPDGVYNQISLNTLQKPNGKYLIDDKSFIFLTKTRDIIDLKTKESKNYNKEVKLIGAIDYGGQGKITPLPGTKVEVNTIHNMLAPTSLKPEKILAENASEALIKKIKSPRILHIATHGFFLEDIPKIPDDKIFGIEVEKARENPLLRSGLMLAHAEKSLNSQNTKELQANENGILTAYEAMNMDLENTELVVLSACETGLGDVKTGEGVYGLQRAFQIAGVDAIIMSMWAVSDAGTQKLMSLFYKNWLKTGNKTEAFKKAQLQLKADPTFVAPFYWGAFILIGG